MDHVYVRTAANHLVEFVNNDVGGRLWNAYDLTFGAPGATTVAGSPDAFYNASDGLIHVYVEAANGDLVEYVNDNAGGHPWNTYDLTYGASGGSAVSGTPSAFYNSADGLIHVYVVAANGFLVEYDNGNVGGHPWNAWGLSAGASGGGPVGGPPSAFYNSADGLIHVYVQGANGDLVEYDNGNVGGVPWNAWDLSVGASAGGAITGTPSPFYDSADGLIHIYVRAGNGQLTEYVNGNVGGHLWNAWGLSIGASGGGLIAGSPSALDRLRHWSHPHLRPGCERAPHGVRQRERLGRAVERLGPDHRHRWAERGQRSQRHPRSLIRLPRWSTRAIAIARVDRPAMSPGRELARPGTA